MGSAPHRGARRPNVTSGRAKREGEWQGDAGFTRQVPRRWGSIQCFPSDSAPATNQTQMRNTNTCTVAQKLYNGACFVILVLFQAFFFFFLFSFFFSVASSNCTYSKLARSVLWRNDFGREWLKRTSWFTTLDYCRAVQSGCVPGVMMGRDPPLCLSHSWAPPAVGAGRPDMPPCWV